MNSLALTPRATELSLIVARLSETYRKSPTLANYEALAMARNELRAHVANDIPPHERDDRCDCGCNMRGVQHEPEDYNVRMRA